MPQQEASKMDVIDYSKQICGKEFSIIYVYGPVRGDGAVPDAMPGQEKAYSVLGVL